ncbi:MAG: YHS domain-containing protein [Chloroflexi bacterium]|nr:YHS domain-containing protein [Chloroflexota bacterium]
MARELSLEELVERTGEPVKHLRRWRSLGLIGGDGRKGLDLRDVERVRLFQLFLRRGIRLEAIARSVKEGQLGQMLERHMQEMFPQTGAAYSLAEAAEVVGMEAETLRGLVEASGLFDPGEELYEEDVEAIRRMKLALDVGFPREALVQMARVYGDTLGRAAEAGQRLFHFYVHERLRATGLSGRELVERTVAIGEQTGPLVEPTILYFYRRAFARASREDIVMHLAEDAGLLETGEVPGQLRVAVVFVDLSSFTPLTAAMGDLKAVEVLERLSDLVRKAVARWEGRVVKQIGDAFMLVFPDPRSAVACTVEVEEKAAGEPQFPAARLGLHWGPVLYREGDYLGSTVNIAARLASEAERHQVLVTAAVRKEASGLAGVEFAPLGKRQLKGLTDDLELFEVRRAEAGAREKAIDPVCGMELGPAEVAARLSVEGTERQFCSQQCLQTFVAAPERYSR